MLKVTLLPWRFKQHAFAGLVLIKSIGSGAGFRVLSAVEMGVYFLFHIKRSLLPNLFGTKSLGCCCCISQTYFYFDRFADFMSNSIYQRLGTKEGEKDIYRMAKSRERKMRDIIQVKCIKDVTERLLTKDRDQEQVT